MTFGSTENPDATLRPLARPQATPDLGTKLGTLIEKNAFSEQSSEHLSHSIASTGGGSSHLRTGLGRYFPVLRR